MAEHIRRTGQTTIALFPERASAWFAVGRKSCPSSVRECNASLLNHLSEKRLVNGVWRVGLPEKYRVIYVDPRDYAEGTPDESSETIAA